MIKRPQVCYLAVAATEFSPPQLTFLSDSYSMSVPRPVLPQWHIKDPSDSVKRAGGNQHLNNHTPLIQWSLSELTMPSRHSVGTYQGNELTHNSPGNARPQLAWLVEPHWSWLKECNWCLWADLHFKQTNKKCGWAMIGQTFPQILMCKEKAITTTTVTNLYL